MKKYIKVFWGCLLALVLLGVGIANNSNNVKAGQFPATRARATIVGAPGTGVSGEALFIQTGAGILPTVQVIVTVRGLAPGSVHASHIHEKGLCDAPGFTTAGGHFDPGPFSMSNPDANHPFHMGDLPPLLADEFGVATINHRTSRITLTPGPLSIFDADGSVILVHLNPDQGIPGEPGSGTAGGPRIACGLIQLTDN